jgi:hypothetical protein
VTVTGCPVSKEVNIILCYKPRNRNIKARDGSVLTDEKGILNRWNEHFRGEQIIQNMEASVKIENLTSKPFSISSGVHQGDPLSAAIFNLILDTVIEKLNLRGDVSFKLKQIIAYADDVALLARSLKALKEIFHNLHNEATLVGLSINEDKTKYMQIKRT